MRESVVHTWALCSGRWPARRSARWKRCERRPTSWRERRWTEPSHTSIGLVRRSKDEQTCGMSTGHRWAWRANRPLPVQSRSCWWHWAFVFWETVQVIRKTSNGRTMTSETSIRADTRCRLINLFQSDWTRGKTIHPHDSGGSVPWPV